MYSGFKYKTLDDVRQDAESLGLQLPLSENIDVLKAPVKGFAIPNRLAVQPMEACDGTPDGSPGILSVRRYERLAKSGCGLLWLEAVAIEEAGRANPGQLILHEQNVDAFKKLVSTIKRVCEKANGFTPTVVVQISHSGRYAKPNGANAHNTPIIAYNNPLLEKDAPIAPECIISDDRLKQLEERYGAVARLAETAGFDGFEVKACHRYLTNELFSAYERAGEYGGSFENRTRFLRNALKAAAAQGGKMFVTSRMNLYDGFAYPYGWGVREGGGVAPDMTEPLRLIEILHRKDGEHGIGLLNFTCGNPAINPHLVRPYDKGMYNSPEHPLAGVARMCALTRAAKEKFPELVVVSSAYSYLRQFSMHLAAGMVESGGADIAGFGRMVFAYPDFAKDMLTKGVMDSKKLCVACSKCSELKRAGIPTGCPIRDADVYMPYYLWNFGV